MPFIFIDGKGKAEPAKRKLMRRHVMLGKNRGKTRVASTRKAALYNFEDSNGNEDRDPGLMIKVSYPKIPHKVGSDFTFTRFAADLEPPLVHDLLKCRFA